MDSVSAAVVVVVDVVAGGRVVVVVPCVVVVVVEVVGTLGVLGVMTVGLVTDDPEEPVGGGVLLRGSSAKERLVAVTVASIVALTTKRL